MKNIKLQIVSILNSQKLFIQKQFISPPKVNFYAYEIGRNKAKRVRVEVKPMARAPGCNLHYK